MCTAILLIRPKSFWPVVLGATRDEIRSRPWNPPDRFWSDKFPNVIGGRDEVAGGTWLAVDCLQQRIAMLLNRRIYKPGIKAKTRGILPLETLTQGGLVLTVEEATEFHPFNLLYASREKCVWWRWDGKELSKHSLKPGLYMLTGKDINDVSTDPRQQRWLPLFRHAKPPDCIDSNYHALDWGDWPKLMADPDSPYDEPSALNVKGFSAKPDFGTVSAALVALAVDGHIRYDFCPAPLAKGLWQKVL